MWFGPMFSSMRLTYINWPIFRYRWVLQLNYLWPWFHLHQHTWSSHLCMWNGLPTNWTSRRTQRDQRLYWYLNACFSDERCFLASWSRGELQVQLSTTDVKCQIQSGLLYCFICVSCFWQMLMSVLKMLLSVVLMPTAQTQLDHTVAPAFLVFGWTTQMWLPAFLTHVQVCEHVPY